MTAVSPYSEEYGNGGAYPGDTSISMEDCDNVGELDQMTFSDKTIRKGFIKKVFGILAAQLVATLAIICIIYFVPGIHTYVSSSSWVCTVSSTIALVCMTIMTFAGDLRRKYPWNFIFLAVFTFFESVMVGTLCTYFEAWQVLVAFVRVMIVALVMCALGFQERLDFTLVLGTATILIVCMLMYGLWIMILALAYPCNGYYSYTCDSSFYGFTFLYVSGVFVFSMLLYVDVRLVVGGTRKLAFSPEEYIFAALIIYLDIIEIFIYILLLMAGRC